MERSGYFKLNGETYKLDDGVVVTAFGHGWWDTTRDGWHFRTQWVSDVGGASPRIVATDAFFADAVPVGPFAEAA